MEVFEAIEKRKSVRKYKEKAIPEENIKKILTAAQLAPSGHNFQPWNFIVVRDKEVRVALAKAASSQSFIAEAPIVIAGITDPKISEYVFIDTAIALEHIALTATELGYGTCWIGSFNEGEVKKVLKIPEKMAVVALMPIGLPNEKPKGRPRKKLSEILFENAYGKEWKEK